MVWICCGTVLVVELLEINKCYPLNAHPKELLGIVLEFREPTENDIPMDEENLRTGSDIHEDSKEI